MSVFVAWGNPHKTSLILTFAMPWRWDDYEQLSAHIEAAFASVPHPVDLVIDVRAAGTIPAEALHELGKAYADATPNLGEYVFVGASAHFRGLFAAAHRYYTALGGQLNYRFVDALETAK
jgi:hypothetical protein